MSHGSCDSSWCLRVGCESAGELASGRVDFVLGYEVAAFSTKTRGLQNGNRPSFSVGAAFAKTISISFQPLIPGM